MSLILEALRRSEAERRRGAPPRLLDGDAPRPQHRASAWPMALAGLGVGALLAAALVGWWSVSRSGVATTSDTAALAMADAPAPSQAPTAAPPPAWARSEPAAIPAAAFAPPPDAPSPQREPAPPTAALASTPHRAPTAVSAVAPTVASPVVTPPGDEASGPRSGDIALGEVIGSAREALPPLRVSMHVYADEPTRRFAIIDGQRLREGDPIGSSAQLVEIRRDGLRVAWQGRTLWVAR